MKTTQNIRCEISDNKQKITYTTSDDNVEYDVSLVLSENGNGEKDIQIKLTSLLKNELRRSFSN